MFCVSLSIDPNIPCTSSGGTSLTTPTTSTPHQTGTKTRRATMPVKPRKGKFADRRRHTGGSASGGDAGKENKDVFHFVNVNPTSETQKSENRSVIRSHASKYIWRQHRAVRADGNAASSTSSVTTAAVGNGNKNGSSNNNNESASRTPAPATRRSLSQSEMTVLPFTPSSLHESAWKVAPYDINPEETAIVSSPTGQCTQFGTYKDEGGEEEEVISSSDSETNGSSRATPLRNDSVISSTNMTPRIGHSGGPFNQLVVWMEDPAFPNMFGESAMGNLMRYAAYDLWPVLVPGADGQEWGREAAANVWLPRAMKNQALYTAFLYGAAGHMQTRRRLEGAQAAPQTREEKLEQIIAEGETIKQLNKLIKDPSQSCSDEVILAVLCMAFSRADYSSWRLTDTSPKAPLRNLQWLDVYGGLSLNDQHVKGLLALIELKGGVDKVKLPGLGETLSVSSIMLSTKYMVKPRLPLVPIFKGTLNGQTPGWPSNDSSSRFGFAGDDANDPLSKTRPPRDLTEAFRDMRDYNSIINMQSQGHLPDLSMAVIADRRNYIQFNLISLNPIHEFHTQFFDAHPLYEPCRLAAMAYSMLVIFPLPASNRPFRRLSNLLRAALVNSDIVNGWQDAPEMLLWVLIMGGMTSRDTPDHTWFVDAFRQAVVATGILAWAQLKPILRSILWMDSVCDAGGKAVWDEMTHGVTP